MQQVLVVANETAVGTHITKRLHELKLEAGDLEVHVVVPASPSNLEARDLLGQRVKIANGVLRAELRLAEAVAALENIGATVTGSVGSPDPMQAVISVAEDRQFDRVLVSTLPIGLSRWLAMDLPHRIARRFKLPVEHLVGKKPIPADRRGPIEGPIKILLVEDQAADIALTRQVLDQMETDIELKVAKNGAEALAALRTYGETAADIVLLDLKMPVLDGHEFLAQAGSELDLDKFVVVVVTTSASQADREKAHALGAGAYVVKDPDITVFAETLASIVNEVGSARWPGSRPGL